MGADPVLPDYRGANLARLVPALLEPPETRPGWLPEPARRARQVLLLVADGLGWMQLQDRLALSPNLASMTGGPITSVVPSTTATALTSLVVGATPAEHGVVGYRVAVEGPAGTEVMNVLKWRIAAGDARPFVDPAGFQPLEPFGGRPVPVVSRADFAGTAFTEAHQRGARQVGWFQPSGLAVEARRLLAAGDPFIYAYYDGIDRVAHVNGFGEHYDAELTALDRIVGDLVAELPQGAALVVTADHGQVEVGARAVELDRRLAERSSLVSGEGRFRWLHARGGSSGAAQALAATASDIYGHEAWVATLEQVESEGWLGGPLAPEVRRRLGDVALVPFEPVAYMDHVEAGEARLACRHGSLTREEMFVPLLARRGTLAG